MSLKRRIERLESARGRNEIGWSEVIFWSRQEKPYDDELQRRYDDYARRYRGSWVEKFFEKLEHNAEGRQPNGGEAG